jgi:hypothetical protein
VKKREGVWMILTLKDSPDYGTYVYLVEKVGQDKIGPKFDVVNFFNTGERKRLKMEVVLFFSVGFGKGPGWEPYAPSERDYQLAIKAVLEANE